MQDSRFNSWVGKIHWRRHRLSTPVFLGFPCDSAGKESACNVETWVQFLGWEDSLEKGKATHSIILAWKIPWTKSTGSQSVGHDWETSLSQLSSTASRNFKIQHPTINYFPEFRPFFDLPIKDYCKIGFIVSLGLLVSIFAFSKGRLSQTLIPWVIEISG